jgi:putative heme-binding domain-containing protein
MKLPAESFLLLMDDISRDADPILRLAAAEVFGKTRLNDSQLVELLESIYGDSLISPNVLLPMLQRSVTEETSQDVRAYLVEAVGNGWRPPANVTERLFSRLTDSDRKRIESILQQSEQSTFQMQSRLAELQLLLQGGDAERGRAVFHSAKSACSTCHRVGNEGGHIGPDLTSIGAIRASHDILESIAFPSSTIAQGHDQFTIATSDGRALTGIIAQQNADTIVLRDSSGADTRLHRNQIEEMTRQPISMMPEGLDRLLSSEELRDLLAYLESLR